MNNCFTLKRSNRKGGDESRHSLDNQPLSPMGTLRRIKYKIPNRNDIQEFVNDFREQIGGFYVQSGKNRIAPSGLDIPSSLDNLFQMYAHYYPEATVK